MSFHAKVGLSEYLQVGMETKFEKQAHLTDSLSTIPELVHFRSVLDP